MKRRKTLFLIYLVSRKRGFLVKVLFVSAVLAIAGGWLLADATSRALSPPVIYQDLEHFRRNRTLKHYLDNIKVYIEPSTTECERHKDIPLLALVSSSPNRFEHREAIRSTWAKHVTTYFILGLNGPTMEDVLVDNYVEAKMYSDMVVFDLVDHYQNLTLKTALMLKWTLDRCPHAQFLFKTDDDVLVNPWTMNEVLDQNKDADLIGYSKENTSLHRNEHNKWYLPRWLHYEDRISQYLSGTGYLINGKKINNILEAAYEVPLVNLEDVYFTYLVAKQKLGLHMVHDARLSPYKPWMPLSCMYWGLASVHSLGPEEMRRVWPGLLALGQDHERHKEKLCSFYDTYLSSDIFLF
ncbi:beta-1,3-galactosyltransferase 1-like [Epargyreus clarus]|uniref:beta-1,3-galactosyltransferase 1-like n=1 Tax=Epargyreus clarus TaxID=520877 RepID=UPI003C2BBC78